MPPVYVPAIPVYDSYTGLPLLEARGAVGTIYAEGTTTPLTLTQDLAGTIVIEQPITITPGGYIPAHWNQEGLRGLFVPVSGTWSTPVWSPQGLEESAAASAEEAAGARASAQLAAQAAQDAAAGVGVPTDEEFAGLLGSVSSQSRSAVVGIVGETAVVDPTPWGQIPEQPTEQALSPDDFDDSGMQIRVAPRLSQESLDGAYLPFAGALPWLARPASYTVIEEKLGKWRTALATGTAQAAMIGTSISEGLGASNPLVRWQTLVQRDLAPAGPAFPFIPADPGMTDETNWPVVRTGSIGTASNWGLGWRTVTIGSDGVVTFTFTGDRCGLMYVVGPSAGSADLTIDGGPTVFIDGLTSATNPSNNAAVWDSGPLTDGPHTVVVRRAASSTISPYVEGLLTYRGDYATGVRVLDAAHTGINSTYFTSGRITQGAQALQGAGGADLVVIEMGTNDYASNITPATFRANIDALIAGIRARAMDPSFVLLNVYMAADRVDATYRQYGDQLRAIAAGDPDIAYFDLRRRMPDAPSPYTAPAGLGLFADPVHPSDAGHAWIGRAMADYLTLRA